MVIAEAGNAVGASDVIAGIVCGAALIAYGYLLAHYEARRSPTGIVRRLSRTGRPVVITTHRLAPFAWDPSRGTAFGGFYTKGVATYTLESPATILVTFQPDSGPATERSCPIPDVLRTELPEARRRRRIARAVVTLYLAAGAGAFALTATFVGGSNSVRNRVAALVALGAISLAWLATHLVLMLRRPSTREGSKGGPGHPRRVHLHRLAVWMGSYALVTAAFALAWKLGNADQTHPTSWASAFVSAAVFVLATAAALAASLHHHSYIHHSS
jgi:hypothetical protein